MPLGNSTRASREIASYVHLPGGAPGPISGALSPTGTGWPPSSDPVLIARAIARCVLGGVADLLVSSFCATCRNGRRESRNGDVKCPARRRRPLQDLWQNRRRRAALFLAHGAFDDGVARRHPPTYVFEGLRSVLIDNVLRTDLMLSWLAVDPLDCKRENRIFGFDTWIFIIWQYWHPGP